jgi:hypothetical protein
MVAQAVLSGTACRDHRQWRVESLGNGSAVPMAAARAAKLVPLSNASESTLRAHDWQP